MAAAARMLSVAREELPVVASELASTARASTSTTVGVAVRAGEKEVMNPVAVRQMAEMSVKESTAGESFLVPCKATASASASPTVPTTITTTTTTRLYGQEQLLMSLGESSILAQHLSITRSALHPPPSTAGAGPGPANPTSLLETLSTTVETTLSPPPTTSGGVTTSVIAQTLERDVGVSVKEAISNAGQTGLEEVVEQVGETGKALLEGGRGGVVSAMRKPVA